MTDPIKIITSRAPELIPGMVEAIRQAQNPLILVPESFTLTTEQALVQAAESRGIIGTQVYSTTSLIREIRERAGFPEKAVITGDGRRMIFSLMLLKNRDELLFYKENVGQISMAEKLSDQIDDLIDGGFSCQSLAEAAQHLKTSAQYKCHDIALLWDAYQKVLEEGYIDQHEEWLIALDRIEESGLFQGVDLLIYGFDYINMNLTRLVTAVYPLVKSITIGLISETGCDDDHIFEVAANSVRRFARRMSSEPFGIPVCIEPSRLKPKGVDPGIRYLEQSVYAMRQTKQSVPDLSHVKAYYAANTSVECYHTAQTLIEWHRQGIAWHDMAVAVCDETTLPSMLPRVLDSAGVPFTDRSGVSMLLSEYAQFFLATLRVLRTGYRQEEMLKLIKSRFTSLSEDETMDLENYVRQNGIDRKKWLKPFGGEDEKTLALEALRLRLVEPLSALRKKLTARSCKGDKAAEAIYDFMLDVGAYDSLLRREQELIEQELFEAVDRNRQVWTAVNELLNQLAVFGKEEHLSLEALCLMLESAVAGKKIKSLPQLADSVIISSPNMFFCSGIKAVAVVGLQDQPSASPTALLTPAECAGLVQIDENGKESSGIGMTRREAAARAKQDIYQAIASATQEILFSCSAAQPNGKVLSPSQLYREVEALLKAYCPGNIRGGLMRDELLPFAPQFALEKLAVKLRAAKDELDGFLTPEDSAEERWCESLAYLYQNETWKHKTQAVLDALHVKIAGEGLPEPLAASLYGGDRMSISAIQTAASCLYWAFLSYGLRVRQRRDFVFETDSQGTFSHEVLRRFFEEAMVQPDWPTLKDESISRLVDRILEEETRPWADGPLGKGASGRFQGEEIVETVRTAVMTLAKAIRSTPHFTPVGMEIGFGRMASDAGEKMHFPALTLTLEDGRKISISGKIDRVDTLTMENGQKAVLVYDFKSADKEVHGDALDEGLQIQLPIYLAAVKQGMPDHVLAGALYQPVKEVLLEADDEDEEKIESGLDKQLQAKGVFLDDETIKEACKPLKVPKKTSTSDLINALSAEKMEQLLETGKSSALKVIRRMFHGETAPNPLQDGMRAPCEYCGMNGACPFDSRLEGGKIRKLSALDGEEEE